MKRSDSTRILDLLTELAETINGPAAGRPSTDRKLSLSERVDKLDTRVSEVQFGLASLAVRTNEQFEKVGERFDAVDARFDAVDVRFTRIDTRFDAVDARLNKLDRNFAATRVELVDHMERIHTELAGRIVDLEHPPKGNRGGNGGVPLAS